MAQNFKFEELQDDSSFHKDFLDYIVEKEELDKSYKELNDGSKEFNLIKNISSDINNQLHDDQERHFLTN